MRCESAKISPFQENIFNRRKFVRPRNTTSTIYVCSDTACCVRCRSEIDCSDPSLYPNPACRPLNCRLHLQRRCVRWTTSAHDARRICEPKNGARRDPRSASRHRRYRHATVSSPFVCSCSRHRSDHRASRSSHGATSCDSRVTWRRALIEGPGGLSRVAWTTRSSRCRSRSCARRPGRRRRTRIANG